MSGSVTPAGVATLQASRRPLIAAVLVFLLAGLTAAWAVRQAEQQRLQEQRVHLSVQVDDHAHAIQRNIERALSATYALAALVRQGQGGIVNFDATARAMLPFYPGAASLQLAPNGIVQQIVPLAGNEKAIGHNLLADPSRDKEAHRARDTGQLTLAGPFNLMQGGLGAVGRLPVFLEDPQGQPSFWGFTSVLIRFPQALQEARLPLLKDQGIGYELSRLHPDTQQKQIIAASSGTALTDPVTRTLVMPNGSWTLSIAPLQGWGDLPGLALKSALGLAFSLLLAYLAKLLLELKSHKHHLEALVAQRTQQLNTSERRYRGMFEQAADAIALISLDGYIRDANPRACELYGYAHHEFVGKHGSEFVHPEHAGKFDGALAAVQAGQSYSVESVDLKKDGREFPIEVHISPFEHLGEAVMLCSIRDITRRRAAEANIQRLTQLYAALSQCNQAIVRSSNEAELFPQICRDVVQFGGMKMAWIGLVDTASRRVNPVASYGQGVDYLQDLRISIEADDPHGGGPTGIAIREQRPVWIQDFLNDPSTVPWQARATAFGWGAVAALPLLRNGVAVAAFVLHAGESSGFDEQARDLLVEMASDISFALNGFERELARQRAVEAVRESEQRYRALIEWTPEAILVHREGKILYVNPAAIKLFGAQQAADLTSKLTRDLIHPDFLEQQMARMRSIIDQVAIAPMVESKFLRIDGTPIDVEVQGTSIVFDGQPAIHVSVRDITERKRAQEQLHLSASVFTHAREGIMITAADGAIIDVNAAFSSITGYARDEVLGRNPRLLSSGHHGKDYYAAMWRGLLEQGHWYSEVWNRRKSGEVYAGMQTISSVRDAQGHTRHYVALFSDITVIKEHQQQLEHIAHFDALTNLPNRVLLAEGLHQGMARAHRHGQLLAVAFLDLDGFKAINDRHGHEAGDQLLIAVATRMKQTLREGDSLARLGGDEFVAVLPDLVNAEACVPMITRLLAAAAQPVQFGEFLLQVSASLGVTFYPQAADLDADQLLRQADQAMYQAKLAGKNRYHLFDTEQDRSVRGHHESLERIRMALGAQEFVLYYQPKVNMRSGQVIGVEALIRWQNPEQGLLSPAEFLPVIEDHLLAIELGEWVIEQALAQIVRWRSAGLAMPVSVNIGARQLQQSDFAPRLRTMLAARPSIKPGDLELEVLETSALEDLAHVSEVIEACRQVGVLFALDDFGTGYSSLTYLKRLAVTQLKIDQSFVRDMLDDPDDLAILEGVIGLAAAFRRQVIAEGVETVAHGEMLLQLGCELAQGYGIARPMPASELPGWLTSWRPDPAWVNLPAVNRDDLPLLFASADHRAWVIAVEAFLKGERDSAPPLDHRQCGFGQWLDGGGRIRLGEQSAYQAIDRLHQQVHALALELLALQDQGHSPQALARLGELHGLRDALLLQLKTLVHARRAGVQVLAAACA